MDNSAVQFIVITLILTITPGIDTFLVIKNVIRGGKKDGFLTALGICSGLFFHATVSIIGISVLLVNSAMAFKIVKTIGALYLLWLGVSTIFTSLTEKEHDNKIEKLSSISKRIAFKEGFFSNILNPKPAIFYLSFFPQFITPGDPIILKTFMLTTFQFICGITWLAFLILAFSKIKQLIKKPSFLKLLNSFAGFTIAALGLKLFFEKAD